MAFLERTKDISFANALTDCSNLSSLTFYIRMKDTANGPEDYLSKSGSVRRATAILRFNLKYSLPVADGGFCRLCNVLISTCSYFNHFLYECEALPPVDKSLPRIPYPYILRPILRGKFSILLHRIELAVQKPKSYVVRLNRANGITL